MNFLQPEDGKIVTATQYRDGILIVTEYGTLYYLSHGPYSDHWSVQKL